MGVLSSGARACRPVISLLLWAMALSLGDGAVAAAKPLEIRVVVVTTWEHIEAGQDKFGELKAWQVRWPLARALPFAAGLYPLQYDPKTHVLAVVTGMATARAASSIMALGLDPRFDLSHAYWVVAGIAGVDPAVASVGSAAWARWVVDGDLAQEIDLRDAPADWPTGVVPYGRSTPYERPAPPIHSDNANVAYLLNRKLADWAYGRTKGLALHDDAALAKLRSGYAGAAARPPFVLEGDGLMSSRFWFGERLNQWARQWVDYWTQGQGIFAMSAEEDSGILQALTQLSGAHRVDLDRVLVLRSASDYTVAPPGVSTAEFLARENSSGFPGTPGALDNLYIVASPIVRTLAENWAVTRGRIPGD
jgi:purine nucleoside permease